jgi:hypothetical protein
MKSKKKVTNERASEYDPHFFSVVTVSKPQKQLANQCACLGVRETNAFTPVKALCMYVYAILL